MSALLSLYVIFFTSKLLQQGECSMQAVYRKRKGKYLANYVIRTTKAKYEQECATHCFRDSVCVSVNFKISGDEKGLCELNSKTLDEEFNEATHDLEFNHLHIIERRKNDASIHHLARKCYCEKRHHQTVSTPCSWTFRRLRIRYIATWQIFPHADPMEVGH